LPWWLTLTVTGLLALFVRLYYVGTAYVDHPLRGDAIQYFAYALNLADHHVFSMAAPDGVLRPDSFRDPGYPAFLALMVSIFGRGQGFYDAVLNLQAILGAATVTMYTVLAKRWMNAGAAAAVGLLLALWPHTITLAGYLLSETLLGFLVAGALLGVEFALAQASPLVGLAAGLIASAAALTNAVVAPVVPLFALICLWRQRAERPIWTAVLLASLLPVLAWNARNMALPPDATASDRIAMNLVQGSWPEYHDAWVGMVRDHDPTASEIMRRIDGEYALMHQNPRKGLASVWARVADRPNYYAAWYARKPLELWGWSIGIGAGDFYVFPTFNSPLSGYGLLRVTSDLFFLVHPLLLLLSACGAIAALLQLRARPAALLLSVAVAGFVTAVFTALQADARYATPYRGIECLLAVFGAWSAGRYMSHRRRAAHPKS
jgi:4-amino-4-deoxy-L-arabinose transferase-like glycosyltransferase